MNESDESSLIDNLIKNGESQTIDFKKKEILSNPIQLAKLMVAFVNTNGGRILIGVCDDYSLEGIKYIQEHQTHIINIARDKCDPPINPIFSVVRKPEGDIYVVKVLRYEVLPHAVVTREGNVYFIRVGSTVRKASPSELALLFEVARGEIISTHEEPSVEFLINEIYSPLHEEVKLMRDNISELKPSLRIRYGSPDYSAPLQRSIDRETHYATSQVYS